ncbi:hypothetical protein THAOC_13592 [Thalassiosira oceanica]|uniref:GOLD domain-containing protein n=1 Tax=Thalassiosira oceanica TaxID=159749 RepID=K0T554_THAOC|nr:hypothetical protein THAOC_13592 [Thalassiosira oceanica]|eukprot:EJK65537.1 hypothetical protein THAOC_13592 [Thalassiosira oceanica]
MTKEEKEQADSSSASATDEATYEPSLADEEAASAAALEEKAIAQAMQSADSSYVPSPSLLASEDPEPLLTQVDGPLLSTYEASKPSVYQAKAVPVALRSKFDVPIHITAGGSVVEFEIFTDKYDIAFGVTAEREEGVTIVRESARVESHLESVTGKFLVGSVPCALVFSFDNEYSWFREKRVSYTITVTPPKINNVVKGRRLRATKALEVVKGDIAEMEERHGAVNQEKISLEDEIKQMEKDLEEKKNALQEYNEEDQFLRRMRLTRKKQVHLLEERLENGWEDEKSEC